MSANAWKAASSLLIACGLLVSVKTASANGKATASGSEVETRICLSPVTQVDERVFSLRALERVVNEIWRPYGVGVEGLSAPCKAPATGPTIMVRVRRRIGAERPQGVPRQALGNIYFVDGKPRPLIDVWVDEAVRLIGASAASVFNGASDAKARVEIARVLGRSLAHELGHYLLGSGEHSETGLMRAQFGTFDVRTKSPFGYQLEPAQVATLHRTLAAWRQEYAVIALTDARGTH